MAHRREFDIDIPLVAAKSFVFAGKEFEKGDPFPAEGFNPRLIRQQYESRAVNHVEPEVDENEPVTMTGPVGGRYTIQAPWLAEPVKARGRVPAEKLLRELREQGPPEGWSPPKDD